MAAALAENGQSVPCSLDGVRRKPVCRFESGLRRQNTQERSDGGRARYGCERPYQTGHRRGKPQSGSTPASVAKILLKKKRPETSGITRFRDASGYLYFPVPLTMYIGYSLNIESVGDPRPLSLI